MVNGSRLARISFVLFCSTSLLSYPSLAVAAQIDVTVITSGSTSISWTSDTTYYSVFYPDGSWATSCSAIGCGNPWVSTIDTGFTSNSGVHPEGQYHFILSNTLTDCNLGTYSSCVVHQVHDDILCYDSSGNACAGGGGGGGTGPMDGTTTPLTYQEDLFMYGVMLFFVSMVGWSFMFRPVKL